MWENKKHEFGSFIPGSRNNETLLDSAVLLERPYALEILASGRPVVEDGLDNSFLLSV